MSAALQIILYVLAGLLVLSALAFILFVRFQSRAERKEKELFESYRKHARF
jgi:hypothetical protein